MYHESEAVSSTFDVLQALGSCAIIGRFFWSSMTLHFGFIDNREGAKEISLVTIGAWSSGHSLLRSTSRIVFPALTSSFNVDNCSQDLQG